MYRMIIEKRKTSASLCPYYATITTSSTQRNHPRKANEQSEVQVNQIT